MWLADWLSQAWEVLFEPEGFGPLPEKLRVSALLIACLQPRLTTLLQRCARDTCLCITRTFASADCTPATQYKAQAA